jgi:hypothetical protein
VQNKTWIDVALAFIAIVPATVAALSSLRNGKRIARHDARIVKVIALAKNGVKSGASDQEQPPSSSGQDDWYKPPDFK